MIGRQTIRGTAWSAIAIFAIFQLATFIPQPLDGPNTLRPILNAGLDAYLRLFARPETAYECWRYFCLLALFVAPALAVWNLFRKHSPGIFFAAIGVTLLVCRAPTLVDYQLNPDEGQFLSAAHKLFYEANFFDSVDCGTSGPLNIYPLMLPAVFGFSPDYASSRMLVLLIAFCAIYIFYRTVRLLAPDSVARLAVLPLAGSFAVFEHPNLVHYSSEQIPILLVALALYFAVRVLHDPAAYRVPVFVLGFLASAAFFSKMQSLPMVGLIGAVAVIYTTRFRQAALVFIAGMLPLPLMNAAMCLAAGVWSNFWMSYIVSNQRYADLGSHFISELPGLVAYFLATAEVEYFLVSFLVLCGCYAVLRWRSGEGGEIRSLWQMAMMSAVVIGILMATWQHADATAIAAYLLLIAGFVILMSIVLTCAGGNFGSDPVRWFGLLSMVATGAAIFSVYRPHRQFPHYLFFLFLPVSAVMAWMLIRQSQETRRLVFPLLFAALAIANTAFLWTSRDPHRFRTTVATIRQPEGDFIRSLTSAEGRIFVWGWTADPYLGSGRVTATRDLNLFYQFLAPVEITSYYRRRLLEDLSHDPPELIVDAIGTDSWAMEDNAIYGINQVPEIAHFVNDFYRHVADGYGERFYLRADLAARAASVTLPKACAPNAVRCIASPRRFYGEGFTTPVMDDLPSVEMPEHALVEVEFTPFGRQTENATILNNEAVPNSFRGMRFQNMGGDLYRLLVGVGDRWEFSRPIALADSKPVWLSMEFAGREVRIQVNGAVVDTMHLSGPVADASGKINIGSWIGGACRFSGTIQFFQIVKI